MAYITDAKTVSIQEKEKLKKLDILIINALRMEVHATHFNLDEALEFIDELKPKKAYLTHISYHLGFHNEVQNKLINILNGYSETEFIIKHYVSFNKLHLLRSKSSIKK